MTKILAGCPCHDQRERYFNRVCRQLQNRLQVDLNFKEVDFGLSNEEVKAVLALSELKVSRDFDSKEREENQSELRDEDEPQIA